MATTSPDNIWTPDATDDYALTADLATTASTVQTAITSVRNPADRNQQFYGPSASLGSVTGMKRGDTYQESDGAFRLWRYDGAAWVRQESGLTLVRPSSVSGSGVSIDANGHVIGTGATAGSVAINGVFDNSKYKRYVLRLSMRKTSATADTSVGFRSASANITSSSYFVSESVATGEATGFTNAYLNSAGNAARVLDAYGLSVDAVCDVSFVDTDIVSLVTHVNGRNTQKEMKHSMASLESTGVASTVRGLFLTLSQTVTFDLSIYAYA